MIPTQSQTMRRGHTSRTDALVFTLLLAMMTMVTGPGIVQAQSVGLHPSPRGAPAEASAPGPLTLATPAAPPTTGTPAATPSSGADTNCSVVLGIGAATDACLAYVNAVPESDPVSFIPTSTDNASAEGLGTGEFADFTAAPSTNEFTVQVVADGAPDDVVAEQSFPIEAGIAYVVVLEQRYDESGASLVAVPLNLAPVGEDSSRVAFHHAVTDAAGLSVSGLGAPADPAILPGETTDPVDVAAGTYEVSIGPANDPEQVLATLGVELEPDLSYLVIVGGTTGDDTVTVIYAAAPVAARP